MEPARRLWTRLAVAAVSVIVAVVVVEGVHALITGSSLLRGAPAPPRMALLDPERVAAAARTEGPYALDADPLVGIRMKAGVIRNILDAPATLDPHGQRVRVGPEAQPGASRILVLGDSVAFGFGVRDDETFAHVIEELLAGTMASGKPRPVVSTVACPGWNLGNSCRYVKDHLARLAPDVVLLLPSQNDLDDGYGVTEAGQRASVVDPARGPSFPHVSLEYNYALAALVAQRLGPNKFAYGKDTAYALITELTPESRRRWSSVLSQILELRSHIAPRGCKLAVVLLMVEPFTRMLEHRIALAAPDLPILPVFSYPQEGDTLENDPHPSPRCIRASAWRMAEFVISHGWVPGAGARALPEEDPRYKERKVALRDQQDRIAWTGEVMGVWERSFLDRIDFRDGAGLHQIYGGAHHDGTVGRNVFAALKNAWASQLEIEIERLPSQTGLYPVQLTFSFNGEPVRPVAIPPPADEEPAVTTLSVDLPEQARQAIYVDVLINASNWITEQAYGISRLASFRLRRLSLLPGR
jgi:hypothetical protein